MSNHAVIKIYNILIPDDDIEVIVEVFEVQDNVLSYPISSEIWHIYKLAVEWLQYLECYRYWCEVYALATQVKEVLYLLSIVTLLALSFEVYLYLCLMFVCLNFVDVWSLIVSVIWSVWWQKIAVIICFS